jgi:hypothetical protein
MQSAGYFAEAYTAEEIQENNILAKASVVSVPEDIE